MLGAGVSPLDNQQDKYRNFLGLNQQQAVLVGLGHDPEHALFRHFATGSESSISSNVRGPLGGQALGF
jgi:hypothetical protein